MFTNIKMGITEVMLLRAGIPRKYWSAQIAAVKDMKIQKEMFDYIAKIPKLIEEGIGVMVNGSAATGKTCFSCILMREIMSYGGLCYFVRATELNAGMRQDMPALLEKSKLVDLLCLDDLGGEDNTAKATRLTEYILRARFEDQKATILTTNLPVDALQKNYSGIMLSIIQRACPLVFTINTNQFKPKQSSLEGSNLV